MAVIVSVMLVLVGGIHLLPLVGVLGPARLSVLYGIACDEPNLAILMRHRAVLFGIVGAVMWLAAVRTDWQPLALASGFASVGSFLWLVRAEGGGNAHLRRVAAVDRLALGCLVVGSLAWIRA